MTYLLFTVDLSVPFVWAIMAAEFCSLNWSLLELISSRQNLFLFIHSRTILLLIYYKFLCSWLLIIGYILANIWPSPGILITFFIVSVHNQGDISIYYESSSQAPVVKWSKQCIFALWRLHCKFAKKQQFCLNFRYPLWESSSEAERGKEREGL